VKRIEFGELRIGEIAKDHILDCLSRNWISMGPKVELLEEKFAEIMDSRYAVGLSSGTAALTATTLSLPELSKKKVRPHKSKVICPALGFIANSTSIISGKLLPKWVDIKPESLNIDENLVEDAIDGDTVAIYAIGTMGLPANLPKLKEIADRHDLVLFEDACENYGASINGVKSHKYAIGGCSSLFQAHLVQAAEFGLVFTDDEKFRDLLVSIRSHGRQGKSAYFYHERFGSNFKPTDLCASIGLEGVAQFHENIKARKKIWYELVEFTQKWKDQAWFSNEPEGYEVMPHGFSITVKPATRKISDLISIFDENYIHWKRNFGFCGDHPALSEYDDLDDYQWAKWCGNNGIHIGCHRFLSHDDVDRMKECLAEFFEG